MSNSPQPKPPGPPRDLICAFENPAASSLAPPSPCTTPGGIPWKSEQPSTPSSPSESGESEAMRWSASNMKETIGMGGSLEKHIQEKALFGGPLTSPPPVPLEPATADKPKWTPSLAAVALPDKAAKEQKDKEEEEAGTRGEGQCELQEEEATAADDALDYSKPGIQKLGGLDNLFWLFQQIDHRHEELYRMVYGGVTSAAAKAIDASDFPDALEILEDGRNQIWSSMSMLSTPVDDLRVAGCSELADELTHASRALKTAIISLSIDSQWDPDPERCASALQRVDEYRERIHQYSTILDRVHQVPRFEKYRTTKNFEELAQTTIDGIVVVVNVNSDRHFPEISKNPPRCDALVWSGTGSPIIHVPLPKLSKVLARTLHSSMVSYLDRYHARDRNGRASRPVLPAQKHLRSILACLWTYIVQPILCAIEQTLWELSTDKIPHLTWCPTGPLALLPLHAAGIYGSSDDAISVSDFVVSSYTPTLSMLLDAYARPGAGCPPPSALIVSQPNTSGHSPLPGSVKEAAVFKNYFPNAHHLDHQEATVESVLRAMQKHPWAHFACHGIQSERDPMKSAFALHDGPLFLSRLMNVSLEKADFAMLSACQTATGNRMVPEEAAHLAGGLLAAGYRTIVATMWSIGDNDAPVVADALYASLLKESGKINGAEGRNASVAYALQDAVKHLREKVGDEAVVQWASFVHYGV